MLAAANAEVLARIAHSRALLAFDFDGTLAPIVAARDDAKMRPRTRTLFAEVCRLYPCAVISGRSRADVAGRLGGVAAKYVVGNHGLEPGARLGSFAREIALVRPALERALEGWPGVDIEDKRYSLAIHYRASRQRRVARSAIAEAVQALPRAMRLVPGKLVVNVVSARAPHKGDALVRLRGREGADIVLYVGDDVTDEDVFQLDQPGRLLSIRVGPSSRSAAMFCLRDQVEIDALLSSLARLRARGGRKKALAPAASGMDDGNGA